MTGKERGVQALRLANAKRAREANPRGISVEEFLARKRIEQMDRMKKLSPKSTWFEVAHAALARPTQEYGGVF